MARELRRLEWTALVNARDLGGLKGAGGETRFGAVVRTEGHGRLTRAGRAALVAYGVRTIIDLRSSMEARQSASPLRDHEGYRNLPFIDEAGLQQVARYATAAESYLWQLESQATRVAAILHAVAGAPAGGVVVHCFAGKDRTGLITALLLTAAGVEPDAVAGDYALSEPALAGMLEEALAAEPDPARRARLRLAYAAPPEAMELVLAQLGRRYGGVEGYLDRVGVDGATRELLRRRLLAPS
jgi:protein-tyrosine phosphatase